MRYVTAVRHLETVGETATADLRLKDTSIGYPLEELWVGGDVLEGLPVVRPSDDQLRSQLAIEAVDCRRHLRHVLDHYWEESWRREHRGFGIQPEDHLWRAFEAVRETEDATTWLGSQ